jgi:hypothetical protein
MIIQLVRQKYAFVSPKTGQLLKTVKTDLFYLAFQKTSHNPLKRRKSFFWFMLFEKGN